MLFILFLISTFLSFSAAVDPYTCSQYLINPPENLDEPYYWPNSWNESMQPATYAGSQNCNWQINVLEGMYATVTFYKDTERESGITCQYPNGDSSYIEDKELNPYIFTNPQFQVNLKVSDQQGMFSFKVVWAKFPGTCKMQITLADKKAQAVTPSACVTTIIAPNHVFFVGFTLADDLYVLLRQALIFNGDSVNSPYIGNLETARSKNIVSSGTTLTVFLFPAVYKNFNYTLYMAMDTKATGDVTSMTGVNCPSDTNKQCYITVNSYVEVSAVVTVSRQTDYIQPVLAFPAGSTLKVYEEQISDDHLLTTIDSTNYMNQLPLGVKNSLKIYHLDTGRISMPMTKNPGTANYGTVFDGRMIKVHSFDHGMTSYYQDTFEVYSTADHQKLYYDFAIKDCDLSRATTLSIWITKDGDRVFWETYSETKPPPTTNMVVYGDNMTIAYETFSTYTTGFQVNLLTTSSNGPTSSQSTQTSTKSMSTVMSTSSSTGKPGSSTASSSVSPRIITSTSMSTGKPALTTTVSPLSSGTTTSSQTRSDNPTTQPATPQTGPTTTAQTPRAGQSTTVRTPTAVTSMNVQTTTKGTMQNSSVLIFCISFLLMLC